MGYNQLFLLKKIKSISTTIIICLTSATYAQSKVNERYITNLPQVHNESACQKNDAFQDDLYSTLCSEVDIKEGNAISESTRQQMEALGNIQLAYPAIKVIQSKFIENEVLQKGGHCKLVAQYFEALSSSSQLAMLMRISNLLFSIFRSLEIYNKMEEEIMKAPGDIKHEKFLELMQLERDMVVTAAKNDLAGDSFDLASSSADLIVALLDIYYTATKENGGICIIPD